jgi:glycerol-3-phosphate acyltransferase PlsY
MDILISVGILILSYLLGSISFARIVSKVLSPETDIENVVIKDEETGDSHDVSVVSATTVSVVLGSKAGLLISFFDILKGFLPALVTKLIFPDSYYPLVAILGALTGHIWPVYHRFKGGGGMSTILGGFLALDWLGVIVCSIGGMLLGFLILKDYVVAYISNIWLMVPWLWIRTGDSVYGLFGIAANILFALALIPDMKQYLEKKKAGKVEMRSGMEATPMGRGMQRMAEKLGLNKKKGGADEKK